ncbi:MAG: SUMF1/EgtB/PvdO family nonheme iron enzyme, partial [Tepidisphaeraceae bacterium]
MVLIPAGEFEMGDHHGFVDPRHESDELPIHTVRLDAFYIGSNDVTTKEYCEFLNAALGQRQIEARRGGVYLAGGGDLLCDTRESSPSSPIGWDGKKFSVLDKKENHPMVCVRWHGAVVYCNWLSAKNGFPACYNTTTWDCDFNKSGFRLPTEAEWEYAARGGQRSPYFNYPWGNDADPTKANVPESRNPFRAGPRPTAPPAGYRAANGPPGQAWRMGARPLTTPVGFFNGKLQRKADFDWPGDAETYQTSNGANGYGLYDMAGNVWQWCTEWYERDYYAYSPAENPPGPAQGSPMPDGKAYRCIRGGSWFNGEFGHSRVSNRDPSYYRGPDPVTGLSDADGPWFHIGFRVIRPVDAESRPVSKPTPVQRVAARNAAQGGGRPGPSGGGGSAGGPRLLPRAVEEMLNLTDTQRQQVDDLEAEARAKLGKILTPEQMKLLDQSRPPRPPQDGPGGGRPNGGGGGPPPAGGNEDRPPRPDGQGQGNNTGGAVVAERKSGFALRSAEVVDGGALPKEFTGDGAGVSPPLEWTGAPAGTKSYALIMHHTDARGEHISYWVLYNIPADVQSLAKDVKGVGKLGVSSRGNHAGYTPPHSAGPGTRTYVYTVYALSAPPQFAGALAEVSHEALMAAMKDKILASADLSVHYTRYTLDAAGEAAGQDRPQQPPRDGQPNGDNAGNDRPPRPDNQGGGQRPGGAGGGVQRPGGGGGGRIAEDNKTPTSPNPGQTVGLFLNTPKACPGYTLLAPKHNTSVYLMDNAGQMVHQWKTEYFPGQSVYLKPNGNLLHPCMTRNRSFTGGGEGGRIEEYDWAGKLIWEFPYSTDRYQQHHDI